MVTVELIFNTLCWDYPSFLFFQFNLEKTDAEEFLEIYKGVVNEYADMVVELSSGTCVALEVEAAGDPSKFRSFVGPADPVSKKPYNSFIP